MSRKSLLIFIILIVLVICVPIFMCAYWGYMPGPAITGEMSLDARIQFIKQHPGHRDILVLGSSMAVNNMDTDVLAQSTGLSCVNAGAYGMRITTGSQLLPILEDYYTPDTVILASNSIDFSNHGDLQPDAVKGFKNLLQSKLPSWTNIDGYVHPVYYWRLQSFLHKVHNNEVADPVVNYLPNGDVPLGQTYDKIDLNRYNAAPVMQLDPVCLSALGTMIKNCKAKKFIYFLTPYRQGVWNSSQQMDEYKKQVAIIRQVVEQSGGVFFDTSDEMWPDSLYYDYAHFFGRQRHVLTESFLKKWDLLK